MSPFLPAPSIRPPPRARILLALLLALVPFRAPAAEPLYDLVIRGGLLLDGTGAPGVREDLAVSGGRIVARGTVSERGRQEIAAEGRVVAPGFIDVHTHAEDLLELPTAENFLRMGVTTLITGNCGTSAPDLARFFDGLERSGVTVNVGSLIGHGTLRREAMGGSFRRPPTAAESVRLAELADQAMRDGALGMSTGLIYVPGAYATTEELVGLARVVARFDGIHASHLRHENALILGALEECLDVARATGVRTHVSHLKLGTPAAWGRTDDVLAVIRAARAEGLAVTQDVYAYTASSTNLNSLVPAEAREGSLAGLRERLADPAQKAAIVAEMKQALERGGRSDYRHAIIAHDPRDSRLNGRSVPEGARLLQGDDSLAAQIELILALAARGGAQAVFHGLAEADLQVFLREPETMIASDSAPRRFGEGVPHPRGYGNNARVLARYVREQSLLSLEEAVRRMTSLPAQVFRLHGRGTLAIGHHADLVIFDPAAVSDPATFSAPHQYATGFDHVIVNGVPVIQDGRLTAARPGRPLRR